MYSIDDYISGVIYCINKYGLKIERSPYKIAKSICEHFNRGEYEVFCKFNNHLVIFYPDGTIVGKGVEQ